MITIMPEEKQNTEKTEVADVLRTFIELFPEVDHTLDAHWEEFYKKEYDKYNSMPLGIESPEEARKTYIKNLGLLKNAIRYKCWETCACYCRSLAQFLDTYPPTPVHENLQVMTKEEHAKMTLGKDLSELSFKINPKNYKKPDMVNHPPHYNVGGLEVIDIIKTFTEGLEGIQAIDTANAIKYILRWHRKNGVEDLKKAKWYIEHLIKEMEEWENDSDKR